jgi:hypothetical protein
MLARRERSQFVLRAAKPVHRVGDTIVEHLVLILVRVTLAGTSFDPAMLVL